MNPTQENPRQESEARVAPTMSSNVININEGVIREHLDEVVTRTLSMHCFYIPGVQVLGDLLNDGSTRSFTWSGRSEILSVTTQVAVGTTVKESFTYDGLQRRISRTDASGTTYFIHDGWNVIAEYRRVGTTNVLQRRYLWGEDLSGSLQGAGGVGGLVQAVDYTSGNAGSYHYHYDGNGNVVEITNVSATVVASYRYDAFGRTLVKAGTYADTNRYRFSTKPVELTSGLYYYGYRYYDPLHGRWTTRDPIEENDGANLYAGLKNSLVNKIDIYGRSSCEPGKIKDPQCIQQANADYSIEVIQSNNDYNNSTQNAAVERQNMINNIDAKLHSTLGSIAVAYGACLSTCAFTGPGIPACFAACSGTAVAASVAAHFEAWNEKASADNNHQTTLAIARNTRVATLENARIKREITIANCPCICPN